MKTRPKCFNEGCENEAFVCMFGKYFCGECVAKWNNIVNSKNLNNMMEVIKND